MFSFPEFKCFIEFEYCLLIMYGILENINILELFIISFLLTCNLVIIIINYYINMLIFMKSLSYNGKNGNIYLLLI